MNSDVCHILIEYKDRFSLILKINMKIDKEHIEFFRKEFAKIASKSDLLNLLNKANTLVYGEKSKIIKLKSFNYYTNPEICKKRYSKFTVRKKTGGERIINAPVKSLKIILRSLNLILQCIYEPHNAVNGFVPNKSIVDNAKIHVGNIYVYNIDLKDFFHSFDRNKVKLGFMYEPFNLKGKKEPIAFLLASLCTHPFIINAETKIVLPQGSPTSPTLSNMLSKKLDRRLNGLAKRFGVKYSRYADDITFSSMHNVFKNKEFLEELKRIIESQGFVINEKKVRLQKAGYKQEVTGLTVNEKVNVRRRYIKTIRNWLYLWETYGYKKANAFFKNDYIKDKGHVKKKVPELSLVLEGKLLFLKMVKGENDSTYLKLNERFERLNSKSELLNEILDIWENDGIDDAMRFFEKINLRK